MTLARYQPWTLMSRLHRELDDLLRIPLAPEANGAAQRRSALIPAVDVHEDAERYMLRADLPGVQPNDIEITADQGVLTIRAERRAERREGTDGQGRGERFAGTFVRRFTLPEDADVEAISARSQHGVLELAIQKQVKPEPRRITVEAA
jgi:HSP20 family protein